MPGREPLVAERPLDFVTDVDAQAHGEAVLRGLP
jgi:hypothetical protein